MTNQNFLWILSFHLQNYLIMLIFVYLFKYAKILVVTITYIVEVDNEFILQMNTAKRNQSQIGYFGP